MMVERLLSRGINLYVQDDAGNTALHVAAEHAQMQIVAMLLQYDMLAGRGLLMHVRNNVGDTFRETTETTVAEEVDILLEETSKMRQNAIVEIVTEIQEPNGESSHVEYRKRQLQRMQVKGPCDDSHSDVLRCNVVHTNTVQTVQGLSDRVDYLERQLQQVSRQQRCCCASACTALHLRSVSIGR